MLSMEAFGHCFPSGSTSLLLADFGGLQRGPPGTETFAASSGKTGKCGPCRKVFFNAERLRKMSIEGIHPLFKN